jgi:signal transduction histidine kinase
MAEELCGIEMMQSDFIANVSHELKTPLAVMQNYATLLQSEDLNEEERLRYAKSISVSCRSLAELITNILKLNKLENQQIYPAITSYHLTEQICECLLSYEKIWEEKEIEIDTDLQEDVHIFSDVELLSLVWNNLFSNALKFTPNGGRVHICLRTEAQHVIVSVTDSGCGISPEVGRHIFEKFYQGDPSHATKGNGLGLALVKRVIDIVGAEISVQSEVGVGSTFTVRIPNAIEAKNEEFSQ